MRHLASFEAEVLLLCRWSTRDKQEHFDSFRFRCISFSAAPAKTKYTVEEVKCGMWTSVVCRVSRTCWNTLQLPVQFVYSFFGANLQSAIHKSGLLMQDCAARPSHSPSFSSPSPLSYIHFHFILLFLFCGTGSYPITLLCHFPFSPNLLFSGSSVLHLVPFFTPLLPFHLSFWDFFFFTLISTFSLSSHTSCLCSFFLLYLLPSLSPVSPSSPIFFRRLLLSPSHPSISPTSHPPPPPYFSL